MKNGDLVSIIIPVFNVAPFLTESLDSVVHQTYSNLEIIIVDDGSTDGSGNICDRYAIKDERIIVIHQDNKGLSAARNTGLDIMTGEAVAFLDSDDAYHLDFIHVMLEALIRSDADLAICRFTNCETTEKMNLNDGEEQVLSIEEGTNSAPISPSARSFRATVTDF